MTAHIWHFDLNTYDNVLNNKEHKLSSNTSILVGGCFDVIHYGHLTFLKRAKQNADHLIVALESDEKISNAKKRAPIHTVEQRAEILANLRMVNEVVVLPFMNRYEEYLKLVTILKPTYLGVTEGDRELHNKQKQADAIHAQLIVVTANLESLSSSNIISVVSEFCIE